MSFSRQFIQKRTLVYIFFLQLWVMTNGFILVRTTLSGSSLGVMTITAARRLSFPMASDMRVPPTSTTSISSSSSSSSDDNDDESCNPIDKVSESFRFAGDYRLTNILQNNNPDDKEKSTQQSVQTTCQKYTFGLTIKVSPIKDTLEKWEKYQQNRWVPPPRWKWQLKRIFSLFRVPPYWAILQMEKDANAKEEARRQIYLQGAHVLETSLYIGNSLKGEFIVFLHNDSNDTKEDELRGDGNNSNDEKSKTKIYRKIKSNGKFSSTMMLPQEDIYTVEQIAGSILCNATSIILEHDGSITNNKNSRKFQLFLSGDQGTLYFEKKES